MMNNMRDYVKIPILMFLLLGFINFFVLDYFWKQEWYFNVKECVFWVLNGLWLTGVIVMILSMVYKKK